MTKIYSMLGPRPSDVLQELNDLRIENARLRTDNILLMHQLEGAHKAKEERGMDRLFQDLERDNNPFLLTTYEQDDLSD